MTSRIRTLRLRARAAGQVSAALALTGLLALPAAAQRPQPDDAGQDRVVWAGGAQGVQDFNASAARRAAGFNLFANADAGGAGGHGTGNFSFATDNYSPCDAPLSGFCAWNVAPSRNPGVATFQFFEVLYFAGAPPSQWAKIRQVAPEVANAGGGGYTTIMNFALFAGRTEWGPRDGTLGRLFAGVTTVADGSCRDHSGFGNGFLTDFAEGIPLLASSNCIPTWPGGVWLGDRTTEAESWKQLFDADPTSFAFDYWRVPDNLKREAQFMGSNFSSYGETTDHYAEILAGYGSAIPGGSGNPAFQGYPLGLVWRHEMFNFGIPSLASVIFYRTTLINRSEDVYGTGVDYDSLYAGLAPGTGGAGAGGGQVFSNYYRPDISAAIYHQSNVRGPGGPCNDATRIPAGAPGCAGNGAAGRGYGNGGNAIILLKSPIGDLRNKLFTRTAAGAPCAVGVDLFCEPSHPNRGDTITFNHGHMCGFGGCWASTHNVSDKRSFGMISSTEDNVIDGQTLTPGSFTFRTFRNIGYPAVMGQFNKYVPGVQGPPAATWDYNKDGNPDTLFFDSCGPNGCVAQDWDTLPGGHVSAYGNVGGVLATGPFALGAGDTTSFFYAFVGETDSTTTWAAINASIDFYLNFFLGPEAPPPATIAATQIQAATDPEGNANETVTFFFDEAPERWVDPFLSKLADDMDAAAPGTPLADLAALNPGLSSQIRSRAADNLEKIEIYKSCNGGGSFTSDGDCNGDPASDEQGNPIGFGWEAYAILDVDDNQGDIPNAFTDNAVSGGNTYLYVLVGKSRGANFLLNTASGPDTVLFSPSIRNTLSRSTSDPNVVSVYVPASRQAGFVPATVTFNQQGAGSTAPFSLSFSDNVVPGNYRTVFGNRLIVSRDSLISTETVLRTRVEVQHVVDAAPAGTPTPIRTDEFVRTGEDVLPAAGSATSSATQTIGDTVRTTSTFDNLGFAVADGTGRPFFVSTLLTGTAATPTSVFALSDFPGFTVNANNAVADEFNAAAEQVLRGPNTRARLNLTDADTLVPAGNASDSYVQWRQQNSSSGAEGKGRYRLTWSSEAFGLPDGLRLNFTNPAATEAELQAGLASRPQTLVGGTDAATAALVGVPQSDLVPVKVPFAVRNETFDRDVQVAMIRRVVNSLLLGQGADTIRVEVQPDQWIPGDELIFLESVTRDSTVGGNVVLDGSGQPVQATSTVVTYPSAVVGCDAPRPPACNPVTALTRGQTGYLPVAQGDAAKWEYYAGFTPSTVFDFDMVAPVTGSDIVSVTDSALATVRVVPNPFVVFSGFQTAIEEPRILWTNVPPTGTMRIYTVSGQFAQQITWTPADLQGAGDLYWDLKTREGIDIASGLYLWVLTAPSDPSNPNSTPLRARGKFVVIRGQTR